jgi:hypothetical protein
LDGGYIISSSKLRSGSTDSSEEVRFGLGEGESPPYWVWVSGERTGMEEEEDDEEEERDSDDEEKRESTSNNDANI